MRTISLVPSITESLIAIGHTPVACTRFCGQPTITHVGGTKDPDLDAITAIRPDLVVMDTEENREEDALALRMRGIEVLPMTIRSLRDVDKEYARLTARLGIEWAACVLPAPISPAIRVVTVIWRRPWMALGQDTYGADLLHHLGMTVVGANSRYETVELATLHELEVDLVVAPDEPYPFNTSHLSELSTIAPVQFVDGRDLFWSGTRTEGAISRLASQFAHIEASR